MDGSSHREFLNQPSPYHDDFHESSGKPRISPSSSKLLSQFFKRFKYSKLSGLEDKGRDKSASFVRLGEDSHQSSHWTMLLFLLLIMSSLVNVFFIFGSVEKLQNTPQNEENHKMHNGESMTGYETHQTTFTADFDYADVYHSSDHLWAELLGGSTGTIYTSENRDDGQVRVAGIGMFHQLHCLNGFRAAIQQLQEGKQIGYSAFTDVSEHKGHWPHCFDYLRQVLLCYADDSIELSRIDAGKWTLSGYDSPRQCRDHKRLYEMTACGEEGCEGKKYWHSEDEMRRIHEQENKDLEAWRKTNNWHGGQKIQMHDAQA